uniref:Reverse transcriptase domain-containing protein n=1 Tax=Cannabis sativa TaxID=3483 RepID=A0A803QGZ6_CANSA
MDCFHNFLHKFNMAPLYFIGNKFTWTNKTIRERLDWAVASDSWGDVFPEHSLHHLGFYGYDHRVLKLVLTPPSSKVTSTPIRARFRFENVWLEDSDFYRIVESAWREGLNSLSTGGGFHSFLAQQNHCVSVLQDWAKTNNHSTQSRIKFLMQEINYLQNKDMLSREDNSTLTQLQSRLDSLLYKDEIYWKQRTRVRWLKAGDRNTKFFHRHASSRRKSNRIKYLKDDEGAVVNTSEGIVELVISYFSTLFSSEGCDLEAAAFVFESLGPGLDDPEVSFLAQEFTAEEVRKAIFQISGDKAVGLDGINAYFYQKNWSVVGADFTKAVLACLNQGCDFSEINSTLIVLIPKKQHANTLKDFRPFSLCTTFYKVISKILANRLKKVLDKIISPYQSAFVSGRVIQDNILIANELVHAVNNRTVGKRGWAALKLNMAKAFDRVEWDFLRHLMFHFNFPVQFVSLIFKCLTTASISFSINGQVHGSLKPSASARRGDPLSPTFTSFVHEGLWQSCEHLHHALTLYSKASGQMAMLAKQAWRIFQYPHSLLSKVLKARYFPNSSILEAVPSHRPSFSWRSILWGCALLKHGLIWKVGNGLTIRTLEDHWLPGSRFKTYSNSNPPSPFLSFFISPSGSWDRGKLSNFFANTLVEDILQVPLSGCNCNDTMIWGPEATGTFTVKSAYHLAIQSRDIPTSSSFVSSKSFWSKIWNLVAPPKIKHLIWRAISHSLPVASSLFFRHIIPTPVCPVCQLQSETVEHALLGCHHAKQAWKHSKFLTFYNNNKDRSFCLFVAAALDVYTKYDLALLFCFIWSIWNQRNNIFHQKIGLSSYQLFDYAVNYMSDFLDANAKQMVLTPSIPRSNRRDIQLPAGQWVVYTDAALDCQHLKHSCGVVAFDNTGCVRAGFMVPCPGVVSPEVAEAKAILAALEWVKAIQLPVMTIASDCQSVVTKISSSYCNNSVLCDVVTAIRNSLLFNSNLSVIYVPRECNTTANFLAKAWLGLDSECIWNGSLPSHFT